MKKLSLFLFAGLLCSVFAACSDNKTPPPAQPPSAPVTSDENKPADSEVSFTLEQLASYNGKDGSKAYIAIDGVVYDASSYFKDGVHNGFEAGKDQSTAFAAQHGTEKLSHLTSVGKLTQATPAANGAPNTGTTAPQTPTTNPTAGSDMISREKAIEIALAHAGVNQADIRDLEVDIDNDTAMHYFEVDFEVGVMEYEYDIDAYTGQIIKSWQESN